MFAGVGIAAFTVLVSGFARAEPPKNMLGFTAGGALVEAALEKRFDTALASSDLKAWLEQMASQPNHVGSPHDRANAEFELALLKRWGWDAHIEVFKILYPTPIAEKLELLGAHPFVAKLHEPAIADDPSSADTIGVLPPYVAYQGDGDVTGPLVYVNYGMPADYRALEQSGVDVRGKIVIARYGSGYRGLKPKLAQLHGAVGCIIYSDPMDDGYATDDPYPKGGQRPADGVQRGSVIDLTTYAGDPLTPGVGATTEAKRIGRDRAPTILKIPAIPISYADALPLLKELGGLVAPAPFRGALPITYHFGPGPAVVHLAVRSEWRMTPIYDVIAIIKGSKFPDQWVMRGNHRDGWVFGAEDPLSGQIALMAEAKAIGKLAASGWRPQRTLVYASWDGEEAGLLGSTEWAEAHAPELRHKAVLYLNSDDNYRGFLSAGGSHVYQSTVNQIADDLTDEESGVSVRSRLLAHRAVTSLVANLAPAAGPAATARNGDFVLNALGSGSDYTPFLEHLGIPSLDLGYHGEGLSTGVYHSAYDTFTHYERFGDPGFKYSIALAKTAGRTMLRVANAEVPPKRYGDFADVIKLYATELHTLLDHDRADGLKLTSLIASGAFKADADPTKVSVTPPLPATIPALDFSSLDTAVARLQASAAHFDQAFDAALTRGALDRAHSARLNAALATMDGLLLDDRGLPRREWYKSLIYAPGVDTGYAGKTLPGIREAMEAHRWSEAADYIGRTAGVLNAYAAKLDEAAALLPV